MEIKPRHFLALLSFICLLALPGKTAFADGPKAADHSDSKPKVKVETVLSGLSHPCGVAVRPETDSVYVADSGSGQIVKSPLATVGKSLPIVIGFPATSASADSVTGTLWGLAFLSHNALATVNTTVKDDKEESLVSVFDLSAVDSAETKPLKYEAADRRSSTILAGAPGHSGESHDFHLALFDFSSTALLIAARRNDDKAGVYKADASHNLDAIDTVHPLFKSVSTNKALPPACMTVNPHGLLVAVQATADDPHAGLMLAFYQVRSGTLLMSMPLPLADVAALAYSSESGRLYAVCNSTAHPADNGLYRLDAAKEDGQAGVTTVKIAELERPTALAFGADSALYVTVLGVPAEKTKDAATKNDDASKTGQLLKITGDL